MDTSCLNNICFSYQIGPQGCWRCFWTGLLASILWPCSPCFAVYLLDERYKLQLFYPDDERIATEEKTSSLIYQTMKWPVNLMEQHRLVCQEYEAGQLTFQWDIDNYQDMKKPRLPYTTITVVLLGPSSPGKLDFSRKLLQVVENTPLSREEEMAMLNHYDRVRAGFRTMKVDEKGVKIMELWEIPPNKFINNFEIQLYIAEASVTLYLFDLDYPESIPMMLQTIEDVTSMNGNDSQIPALIVIIYSHNLSLQTYAAEDLIAWAKSQPITWKLVAVNDDEDMSALNNYIMNMTKEIVNKELETNELL